MNNLLHGFADELTKIGFSLRANKSTGPAGPVAAPKPLGSGGGPTNAGLKGIGRQQMNFSTKQKKPSYVPVGTQTFKPKAPVAPPTPSPKKVRKKKAPKDIALYESAAQGTARRNREFSSAKKVQGGKDEKWFNKNTPKADGKARAGLSPADRSRHARLKSLGPSGRASAASGNPVKSTTIVGKAEMARNERQRKTMEQRARIKQTVQRQPSMMGNKI